MSSAAGQTGSPGLGWIARYPDLTGKTVIVAAEAQATETGATEADAAAALVDVVRGFAANGCLLAVISPNRERVDAATSLADSLGAQVLRFVADPADSGAWERLAPHIEQRLGPIDIAVYLGADAGATHEALSRDMAARGRGVLVDVPGSGSPPDGVRYRQIEGGDPGSIAAASLLAASDCLTSNFVVTTIKPELSTGC